MAKHKPPLQDVARRAGVSSATISRALNDPDKVAPDTRATIDQAILDLGYSPNFGARVLRRHFIVFSIALGGHGNHCKPN